MPAPKIDDRQLAVITAGIGFRLRTELDRDQTPLPPQLERLVRALDDAEAMPSPSIAVDDHHQDGG